MENFENFVNKIKNCVKDVTFEIMRNNSLNQDLLFVFLSGATNCILVYDGNHSINEIAEIRYVARNGKCFISTFECDENFQGNGIGKTIFNLALAHADALNIGNAYGYANPTNNIAGVSEEENFEKEKQALYTIYEKLGCTLKDVEVFENRAMEKRFEQTWTHGDKLRNLSKKELVFVKKIVNLEKNLSQ